MKKDNFEYTVDPTSGTVESHGYLELTKGDHTGMPKRTDAYPDLYERGHLNASSLGGTNGEVNIQPQAKDLNHHAYYSMENGEREALKSGASIESHKVAHTTGGVGTAPDCYMVNDTVTYADGKSQTVHLSFANLNDAEQEAFSQTLDQHTDLLDAAPNPGDVGREMYSPTEYAELMEECEASMGNVQDEYSEDFSYSSFSEDTMGPDADDDI